MKTRHRHSRSEPSGQDIQSKMSLLPVCIVLLSYALMKGCAGAIQCHTCDDCQVGTVLNFCPSDEVTEAIALTTTTSISETTAGADVTEAEEAGEGDEAEPVEAEPAEAEPAEVEPAEAEPAEAEPAEGEPAEAEPAEAEPAEAEAIEAEAIETEAVEGEKAELQSISLLSPDFMSNLNITRRKRESASIPVTYHCFSVEIDDGERIRTKKGCVKVPKNSDACAILKEKYQTLDKSCVICSQDKCNSGVVLKYSLAAALLVVVNSLLQW